MSIPRRFPHLLGVLAILAGSLAPLPLPGFLGAVSAAANTPEPKTVTIAGTLQSELGCEADWMFSC
jgi:hypothetical protein